MIKEFTIIISNRKQIENFLINIENDKSERKSNNYLNRVNYFLSNFNLNVNI